MRYCLFTFIAFVLSYIIFLSDFGDIFDTVPTTAFQAALFDIEKPVHNLPVYVIQTLFLRKQSGFLFISANRRGF